MTGVALRRVVRRACHARFLRFAAVGASGMAVNLGTLALLAGVLRLPDVLASAAAVEVSIVSNFALNDLFTFGDCRRGARNGLFGRLARYNLVSLVGMAVQVGTFVAARLVVLHAVHRVELGELRYPVQAAGIALAMAWNFACNVRFTWAQVEEGGRVA